jgi:hypothetical protein
MSALSYLVTSSTVLRVVLFAHRHRRLELYPLSPAVSGSAAPTGVVRPVRSAASAA